MSDQQTNNLILPDWPAPDSVHAFSTTRRGGVSQDQWESLNLGLHCGDNVDHVEQNREILQEFLPGKPRWLKQLHSTNAINWADALDVNTGADAIASHLQGQVCAVLTADCLPVLFCNKAGTKVAAAHAGWRGLANGILESTVREMDCEPSQLMAWMGPAIGPDSFQVQQDVIDVFEKKHADNLSAFKPYKDRWLANLYQLATLTLSRCGVEQVYGGQHCTFLEREKFFSYRRDGVTGRMACVIWANY